MSRFKLPSGQTVQIDTPFEIEQIITVPAVFETIDDEQVEITPASQHVELIQHPSGVRGMSVEERAGLGIIEVQDDPRPDDRYGFVTEKNGSPGEWDYTPFPAEMLKDRLITYAKSKRWDKEQGGFTFNGMSIATDDRSQSKIMSARIAAAADSAFTTPWAVDTTVFMLDAPAVIALSDAVLEHVKGAFVSFAAVMVDISNESITTFEAIDEEFA